MDDVEDGKRALHELKERAMTDTDAGGPDSEDDDFGCDYCREDGKLVDGRCPKCDAEYDEDDG